MDDELLTALFILYFITIYVEYHDLFKFVKIKMERLCAVYLTDYQRRTLYQVLSSLYMETCLRFNDLLGIHFSVDLRQITDVFNDTLERNNSNTNWSCDNSKVFKDVRSSDFGKLFYVTSCLKSLHHILTLFVEWYFTVQNKPYLKRLLKKLYIFRV